MEDYCLEAVVGGSEGLYNSYFVTIFWCRLEELVSDDIFGWDSKSSLPLI